MFRRVFSKSTITYADFFTPLLESTLLWVNSIIFGLRIDIGCFSITPLIFMTLAKPHVAQWNDKQLSHYIRSSKSIIQNLTMFFFAWPVSNYVAILISDKLNWWKNSRIISSVARLYVTYVTKLLTSPIYASFAVTQSGGNWFHPWVGGIATQCYLGMCNQACSDQERPRVAEWCVWISPVTYVTRFSRVSIIQQWMFLYDFIGPVMPSLYIHKDSRWNTTAPITCLGRPFCNLRYCSLRYLISSSPRKPIFTQILCITWRQGARAVDVAPINY